MSSALAGKSREQIVALLAQQLRELEGSTTGGQEVVTTGCMALDCLLPAGGLRRGSLVEWLSEGSGTGAGTLALLAARQALPGKGPLVVIDRPAEFYPPGAAALGMAIEELIVIQPRHARDDLWAIEQVLRCEGVGAAWCRLDELSDRALRRLQLAAERGGSVGMLLRPAAVRRSATWADARFWVEPLAAAEGRRWRVELLHARGGQAPRGIELEIDDEAGVVRVAARLAPAAAVRRAARA